MGCCTHQNRCDDKSDFSFSLNHINIFPLHRSGVRHPIHPGYYKFKIWLPPLLHLAHLEDSTVQKPPVSSTSSPGPPPGFRGSYRGRIWALSGGFLSQVCKRSHDGAATCWCVSGAGWPGSSHGWSPAAPWPVIWGQRWTAVWPAGCSPAPPGAAPALKNIGNQEKCWLNFCQTFFF